MVLKVSFKKRFPLSGFIEMRYNEIEKRVVNESLELCQEYRTFSFLSPWESQNNFKYSRKVLGYSQVERPSFLVRVFKGSNPFIPKNK